MTIDTDEDLKELEEFEQYRKQFINWIPTEEEFERFYRYVLMFWSPYNIPTKEEIIKTTLQFLKKSSGNLGELETMAREAVTTMIDRRRNRKYRNKSHKDRKIIHATHNFINGYCKNCNITDEIKIHRKLYDIGEFYTCSEQVIKNIIE